MVFLPELGMKQSNRSLDNLFKNWAVKQEITFFLYC